MIIHSMRDALLLGSFFGLRQSWPFCKKCSFFLVALFFLFSFLCSIIPIFRGAQHIYCTKLMLTVAYNNNPIINNISDTIHNDKTY